MRQVTILNCNICVVFILTTLRVTFQSPQSPNTRCIPSAELPAVDLQRLHTTRLCLFFCFLQCFSRDLLLHTRTILAVIRSRCICDILSMQTRYCINVEVYSRDEGFFLNFVILVAMHTHLSIDTNVRVHAFAYACLYRYQKSPCVIAPKFEIDIR